MSEVKGWPKLKEEIEKGNVPTHAYCSKATTETCLKRPHFELFDAYNIKLRVSEYIPYRTVMFIKSEELFL